MWGVGRQGGGTEQTGHGRAGSWIGKQLAWKSALSGAGMLRSLLGVRSVLSLSANQAPLSPVADPGGPPGFTKQHVTGPDL